MTTRSFSKKFFLFVCGSLLAATISGCTNSSRMELVDGTFGTPLPKEFHGVGRNVPQHTLMEGITLSGNYFKDREVQATAYNKDTSFSETVKMPHSKADITYKLPQFNVNFDFELLKKFELLMAGLGGGAQLGDYKSVYFQFMLGINHSFFEAGMFANAVFAFDVDSRFRGYRYYGSSYEMGYYSEPYKNTTLSEETEYRLQPFGTLGLFAGVYWGQVGLNASVTYLSPWMGSEDDLQLTIDFPGMISLYTGISAWITNSWKLSAGPTFLFGGKDPALAFGGSLEFWM